MTCPNRDGTCGDRGCIFCSAGGSGDFAGDRNNPSRNRSGSRNPSCSKSGRCISSSPISRRIRTRTRRWNIWKKFSGRQFRTRRSWSFRSERDRLLRGRGSFSLEELNRIKPVWVELGLQTMHEKTAQYIRRGYPLSCFEQAVNELQRRGIPVIVHTILGLPGRDRKKSLQQWIT